MPLALNKQPERYRAVESLVASGASFAEIKRQTGVDYAIVKKYFPQAGKSLGGDGGLTLDKLDPDRFAALGRMVADGASLNEIRRTLGCDHRTVHRHFPNAGWEHGGGGAAAAVKRGVERLDKMELK